MSRPIVKICGLNTPNAVSAAINANADMIGFVFFNKSPRNVTIEQAAALSQIGPDHITRVGLFVNPADEDLTRIVDSVRLDVMQIHNVNNPSRIVEIKALTQKPVYAAAGIATREDLESATELSQVADGMFYDAKASEDPADLPGGRGVAFDWSILSQFKSHKPWLLAGGLTPDNVAEAIRTTGTRGVDVSSGVETRPGVKDSEKIRSFISNAHAAF